MFCPLDLNQLRQPVQWDKICCSILILPSSQSKLLEYIKWDMDSLSLEFALYGSKNKCARTDTVFFPISQVCTRGVTLTKLEKTVAECVE